MFGALLFFPWLMAHGGERLQAVMGKAVQEIQLESQSWYAKAAAVVEAFVVGTNGRCGKLEKRCLFRVP